MGYLFLLLFFLLWATPFIAVGLFVCLAVTGRIKPATMETIRKDNIKMAKNYEKRLNLILNLFLAFFIFGGSAVFFAVDGERRIVGVITTVIGVFMALVKFKRDNKRRKLFKIGKTTDAIFLRVEIRKKYRRSSEHRAEYRVICKGCNPETGEEQEFTSQTLLFDPRPVMEEKNLWNFMVYCDLSDIKNYYIDISEIFS